MDEEDPVVQETNVYLSHALSDALYLLQYPLRPGRFPIEHGRVLGARIKPEQAKLQMDVALETRGEHYSRSRGEAYGRAEESSRTGETGPTGGYKGGMMDRWTLTSKGGKPAKESRYFAGVLKDGELHLTPLKGIIQLRPSQHHLDHTPVHGAGGTTASDGETTATESEEEEARPVTVRFSRPNRPGPSIQQGQVPDEPWKMLVHHAMESEEATDDRELLFAPEDDQTRTFSLTPGEYLNVVCPLETYQKSESPPGSSEALSLAELKSLPFKRQVPELLKKTIVVQFDRVCSMLGKGRHERGQVLEQLVGSAMLVQGCWVVQSALVIPKEKARLRLARDYVLWCFTRNHSLTRKDLPATLKISHAELTDLLKSLAVPRVGGGWEFKLSVDVDFHAKYPQVVKSQHDQWETRHSKLVSALGIGVSPEHSKLASSAEVISGQHLVSAARQKAAEKQDVTPSRVHALVPAHLQDNLERDPTHLMLKEMCVQVIGRGVVTLQQLRDHMLLEMASNEAYRQLEVSDSVLEAAVLAAGAVELGQQWNKRLFAMLSVGDQQQDVYRLIILRLFQTVKSLKKKQVADQFISSHQREPDNKALTTVLKELCYSKGAHWFLKETAT